MQFQSTRPRGARLGAQRGLLPICSFNPRAHVGRDLLPPHALLER